MHNTRQNAKHKIWVRELDVEDVPKLWDLCKPSTANKLVWAEVKRQYDDMLTRKDLWMGSISKADLNQLVSQGWAEGARKALALVESFKDSLPAPTSRKRRAQWSDQGDDVEMQRVYSGHLDTAWRRTVRVDTIAPQIVSIALPWAHSAMWGASALFWGGAAVLAITDLLEDAGYSVNLVALNCVQADISQDWLDITQVNIKRAGEPLRPDSVAAMFCHAGTYRYYGIQSCCEGPGRISMGMGIPANVRNSVDKAVQAGVLEDVQIAYSGIYSERQARQAIEGMIKQIESGTFQSGGRNV